ncbi:hypothetical protein [Duganella sp. BuS-21]|uniref:hypothetical protein n=1 Tax=Duganella sp. BuS-21 TaxID=2943848 RepID=UPI0035A6A3E3
MTHFTNVQLVAQNDFRNIVRAVALKKWTTANTAHLTLKGALINEKIDTSNMISAAHGYMWGAYIQSAKDQPIRKMIDKFKKLMEKEIKTQIAIFRVLDGKDLTTPVLQLRKATLEDKRAFLRAAQVISAPVASAYLGVTSGTLNKFVTNHCHVIGGRYARGNCLSMDEVFLIEQNPKWMDGDVSHNDASEVNAVDDTTFDYLLYVGEDLACAFTDMTPLELRKAIKAGAQALRPYRLSDLEKIRVAKLNGQQQ